MLSYSPSVGLYPYRKALVSYYNGIGMPVVENDILVTTGVQRRCCSC